MNVHRQLTPDAHAHLRACLATHAALGRPMESTPYYHALAKAWLDTADRVTTRADRRRAHLNAAHYLHMAILSRARRAPARRTTEAPCA